MRLRIILPLALVVAFAAPTPAPAQDGQPPVFKGGLRAGGDPPCSDPGPARREADRKIYSVAQVDCRVLLLSRPGPAFTEEARRNHPQGKVAVRLALRASGKVDVIEVVSGISPGIDAAVLKAARAIKFRPAIKGNRRVSQYATVQYSLADSDDDLRTATPAVLIEIPPAPQNSNKPKQ